MDSDNNGGADRLIARIDELDQSITSRIDGLQAEIELRFADTRDLITAMNRTLATTAAVLAQHLQDHQHGDAS